MKKRQNFRHSYSFIKKEFEKYGYILISDTYINAHTKLKCICSCGNPTEKSYVNLKVGKKCSKCCHKRNIKLSLDEIKNRLKLKGFELISTEYKNVDSKIQIKCKCGTLLFKSLGEINRTPNCHTCKNIFKTKEEKEQSKLRKNLGYKYRSLLKRLIRAINYIKNDKTCNILGYSSKDLINHITSHKNWKKIQDQKLDWDIDHIFPIKAFIDYGINDPKLINSLDNLQPLQSSKNKKKSFKYNKQKFEKWLKNKI